MTKEENEVIVAAMARNRLLLTGWPETVEERDGYVARVEWANARLDHACDALDKSRG